MPSLATGTGMGIDKGMNRVEYHDQFEKGTHELIDISAKEGVTDIILLTGERKGMSDQEGLENCVKFLNKVKKHAEDKKITLVTELLNSKVDHPDYMCDHTAWGVEMCKRVDSPSVKLLYDIYHMQIMEGDIIRTIRKNYQYMGHFHTAGNPGRHEMDDTQEMNYAASPRRSSTSTTRAISRMSIRLEGPADVARADEADLRGGLSANRSNHSGGTRTAAGRAFAGFFLRGTGSTPMRLSRPRAIPGTSSCG